jgi:chemotaxis protein MotB
MSRKAKAAKPENHERWVVTFADMLMLLLALFVVLYAGSSADKEKYAQLASGLREAFNNPAATDGAGGSSAIFTGTGSANMGGSQQALADFQAITTAVQRATAERGIAPDRIELRMEPDRIVIGLTSDLLFSSGSAQLRPSALPLLDAVADSLKDKPNEIRVEGHTDNVPINSPDFTSNWELSAYRAIAVLRRLVEDGVAPGRIFAAGYADTRPKATNATAEGRSANRRAEIVVLYPSQTGAGASPSPIPTPQRPR